MICRCEASGLGQHHSLLQLVELDVAQVDADVLTGLGEGDVASKDLKI